MRKLLVSSVLAVALLGMVSLTQTVSANPPDGPITGVSRVAADGVNVHFITYRGGEQADFAITGDGDTTLNVIVKDQFGNVVARTSGFGDRRHVIWTPSRTAVYSIFVVNDGGVYNQYSWRAY